MQDPRDDLQRLIQQGRSLLESLRREVPSPRAQKATVNLGTSFLAAAFDAPALRSGIARTVGRALVGSNAAQKHLQFDSGFRQWEGEVRRFLNTVSTAKATLSIHGNSAQLVGRFSAIKAGAKLETKLGKAVRLLETLHGQPLVYNGEIPELLKLRQAQKAQDRKAKAELRLMDLPDLGPGFDHEKFQNRAVLHTRFADFPVERQMIEGAIDTFVGDGPDRFRQALGSCRVALESMGKRITGQERWRDEIGKAGSDAARKIFRDLWDLLSSYGSHAGKTPTKDDAEFGIQQTLSCLIWLMNHRGQFNFQTETTA